MALINSPEHSTQGPWGVGYLRRLISYLILLKQLGKRKDQREGWDSSRMYPSGTSQTLSAKTAVAKETQNERTNERRLQAFPEETSDRFPSLPLHRHLRAGCHYSSTVSSSPIHNPPHIVATSILFALKVLLRFFLHFPLFSCALNTRELITSFKLLPHIFCIRFAYVGRYQGFKCLLDWAAEDTLRFCACGVLYFRTPFHFVNPKFKQPCIFIFVFFHLLLEVSRGAPVLDHAFFPFVIWWWHCNRCGQVSQPALWHCRLWAGREEWE